MSKDFQTVSPDTPLNRVVDHLLKRYIPDVPMVMIDEDSGRLKGFVSERDCVDYYSNEIFYANPDITARSVIKRNQTPQTITVNTDIFTAASIMVYHDCHFLPVVEDKKLIGILGRQTLLRGLHDYRDQAMTLAEERASPDLSEIANHRFIANN
ncbi:MAG: CBS domain-containing protein [Gammaproteobacteria bacterium]|nr:CBS domain-containing protein [Gammaproteobacteria bacterium]